VDYFGILKFIELPKTLKRYHFV